MTDVCEPAAVVFAALIAALGLTIASEWMFAPELASGAVISVLNEWSLPPIDLWVVFPTGRQATAKARVFADFVERRISADGSGVSNNPG